jgi:glycylpeptide N-tetradecanoyltransferase
MLYRKKVKEGEIRQIKPTDVSQEPIPLPAGFEWKDFDVTNDDEVSEICDFLEQHYVEDVNGYFKVTYTLEKFRWAV